MTPEVLVVGGGPTGLTMAVEVARRGVAVRVIDAAAAPTTETRALGVQPRTLELFERLDLAEAAVAGGVAVSEFNVFSEGKRFLHLDIHDELTRFPNATYADQTDALTQALHYLANGRRYAASGQEHWN